ncbi:hypothetical protein A2U01_0067661, partial [Trifolium medium]|nr:hypothetical protein [Trifolium medium]
MDVRRWEEEDESRQRLVHMEQKRMDSWDKKILDA